jgi:hypothetical protein
MPRCLDWNLIGILVSSIIIIACLLVQYFHADFTTSLPCNSPPSTSFMSLANATATVQQMMNLPARHRVLICTSGTYVEHFIEALAALAAAKVPISIILPTSSTVISRLKQVQIANITTDDAIGANFIVVDDVAFLFRGFFTDYGDADATLLTTISGSLCSGALEDIVSFFNFRYLAARGAVGAIVPLGLHAKTSVVAPLQIGTSREMMYFFHNPDGDGDPIRVSSSGLLPESLYLNAGKGPHANVSIFCDRMPSPAVSANFSLFRAIIRVLIAVRHMDVGRHGFRINLLIPAAEAERDASRWLNATAAFAHAELRLYDGPWSGPTFIVIGERAFVFSHALTDQEFDTRGFHMSTNSTEVVRNLTDLWNEVWSKAARYIF